MGLETKTHSDSDFERLRVQIANKQAAVVNIQGNAPDIDTVDPPMDLWPYKQLYPFPTTDVNLDIVSTSANDTLLGTGAITIIIKGIDTAFDDVTEVINLNGLTPVTTTNQFYRVNTAFVIAAGSLGVNDGDIHISNSSDASNLGCIQAGYGELSQSVYSVGKGFREVWIQAIHFRAQKRQNSWGEARVKVRSIDPISPWQTKYLLTSSSNGSPDGFSYSNPTIGPIPSNSEIRVEVDRVDSNDTGLYCNIQLFLVR